MDNYNDPKVRLRGRKFYWHQKNVNVPKPPNDNENTQTILHPLAAGATARVCVRIDHLTDLEPGALLEAIEPGPGLAHKLGMGKALGFGSVSLEVEKTEIVDVSQAYSSLADRLRGQRPAGLAPEQRLKLRGKFRETIPAWISASCPLCARLDAYGDLPPIADLRRMLDFDNPPAPRYVQYMPLHADKARPEQTALNYGLNAILPGPREVGAD